MSRTADTAARVLSFGYRDRGGPLQQARATTVVGWCVALGLVLALFMNPLVLAAVLLAVAVMAWRCRVIPEMLVALAISLPVTILIALVNPIASQQGVTVWVAGIHLPVFGTFDITQEAVFYGLVLGLRSAAIFAVCALYVCTVSPDELLRVLRRYSVRSAITASLAVRFVPTLARDGANLATARACRPGAPPSTGAVVRAAFARSLERAGDAALALETRGFALARPMRVAPAARTLADRVVAACSIGLVALVIAGTAAGLARFTAYPLTSTATAPRDLAFAAAIAIVAALPAVLPRRYER
ncbi:MAG: energy-coupling factor transporter transmembrane protein EcfT [Thermoleophilaceae bacterium]|nr:energy-coupling factor transporter transmembrane protein EcfT [Thermoleophilaceae bacterium]